MSSQLPPTVQLDGFDISDGQFPHKSVLPSNMTLRIQDAFAEVPAELIGTYDVVHMRFWCCVVKDQNTGPLIRHAMSLLSKPPPPFLFNKKCVMVILEALRILMKKRLCRTWRLFAMG